MNWYLSRNSLVCNSFRALATFQLPHTLDAAAALGYLPVRGWGYHQGILSVNLCMHVWVIAIMWNVALLLISSSFYREGRHHIKLIYRKREWLSRVMECCSCRMSMRWLSLNKGCSKCVCNINNKMTSPIPPYSNSLWENILVHQDIHLSSAPGAQYSAEWMRVHECDAPNPSLGANNGEKLHNNGFLITSDESNTIIYS